MLLRSIELHNFRQFINEKIDFSTDPERNVTLVIGDNGTGKTTFAQAFTWCLYGETDFSNKVMLNRIVAEKMTPDQKVTVKVVLALTHGDADYEIIRSQEYRKSYSNKITGANTALNISRKNKNGGIKYLKPNECEFEIKKIIPKELAGYFFFDGERIEKMSKEIASGHKSSNFSNAVQNLTGLNATLTALEHLSTTRKNSVYGKFNEAYKGDSDGKMQQLTKEIDALQAEIDRMTNRQSEIEDELSAARASKAKFEQDIKQFADGERLQNERDNLNKQLINARSLRAQVVKRICKSFNEEMTNFLSLSLVLRSLDVVSHSDFSGKDIPEMHAKTIDFLLNRGTCICGTHLDPGTIPYNKVKELLEFLPPQSIGVTVGQFVKDSQSRFLQNGDMYEAISEQLGTISQQDDHISDLEDQIATISAQLDGDDVREQVKKLNAQIKSCDSIIAAREHEKRNITFSLGAKDTEKKLKENSRAELSLLDKSNRKIEICKAYTERIYQELYAEYKSEEKRIRENLESSINEIFKTIYNGGLSLTIDERYNISVYVTDYEGDVETSTAQSIAVIFAFISAIIKMARENQRIRKDEAYSEPYPLVMDAPLSAFDKRRIKAICSAIPETAEQVIIFIKDTDGELAEEHLGAKVMTRHYFEKINEFETRLS
jgi:DNA sulfur modification protein DndD